MKPIETQIRKLLNENFEPLILEVENESDMHSGPPGRESHFKVYLVSEKFENETRIARQRQVFEVLGALMTQVHALSLRASTPLEHEKASAKFTTPECASKKK